MLSEKEFYEKLLETLEAMSDRRLCAKRYWDRKMDRGCALGEYVVRHNGQKGEGMCGIADYVTPPSPVWAEVHAANDGFIGTPEGRWAYMHAWVKKMLNAPGA